MKRTTKHKVGVLMALIGLLALLCACNPDPQVENWQRINVVNPGVIEKLKCDKWDSANRQISNAVKDEDEAVLTDLGLWRDGKLDGDSYSGQKREDGSGGVKTRMKARGDSKECVDARKNPPTTTVTASASSPASANPDSIPDDGKAGVRDTDGTLRSVPLVGHDGEGAAPVDTTDDPRSPATLDVLLKCKQAKSWYDLVVCVGDDQTYKDAVNARKSLTGFDWDEILRFAKEPVDARVIQVFNWGISDREARDRVRELVGSDADKLPIARHGVTMNTRRFEDDSIHDFADIRQMARVSLAPLVYKSGKVVALRADSGIFVDCFNIWWLPQAVVINGAPPKAGQPGTPGTGGGNPPGTSVPPTTVPPTTVPPTTVPPTNPSCPPGWTGTPPLCKDPTSDDPAPRGNAPIGGGRNADPGPGVQQPYTPPPAAPYTPPAVPTVQPTQPPVITQQPQPTSQPTQTVAPSTQPPNNGSVVPTPGGDFG